MSKTVKIAVSMSDAAFKRLESFRRKTGKTRSQLVREALAAVNIGHRRPAGVEEERAAYETPGPRALVDPAERRRRAIAAAGRFRSGLADLAENHDRYLEEIYAGTSGAGSAGRKE